MQSNLGNFSNMSSNNSTEDVGKTYVNIKSKSKSPLKSTKNFDEGEYVDFTEIK